MRCPASRIAILLAASAAIATIPREAQAQWGGPFNRTATLVSITVPSIIRLIPIQGTQAGSEPVAFRIETNDPAVRAQYPSGVLPAAEVGSNPAEPRMVSFTVASP